MCGEKSIATGSQSVTLPGTKSYGDEWSSALPAHIAKCNMYHIHLALPATAFNHPALPTYKIMHMYN